MPGMAWLIIQPAARPATAAMAGETHAAAVTAALAAAFVLAGAGVFVPPVTRAALVIAVLAALIIWSAGEHFGGILTGQATDPNSGPLLILLAAAFWPARRPYLRQPPVPE